MDNTLLLSLRKIVDDLKEDGVRDDAIQIALKDELQYYVLDFVYNSPKYSHLIMYGGSLLRIAHGLDRMSEDLDFQSNEEVNKKFLEEIKGDLISNFRNKYNQEIEISIRDREGLETKNLVLKFNILKDLGLETSRQVLKLTFDINFFEKANAFSGETVPVVRGGLSFNIKTYSLSILMASKILAVFHRKERGIGSEISNCKPRDIYDLIWYLEKKISPDIDYLKAKGTEFDSLFELFKELKYRVNNLGDKLFEKDLSQFFYRPLELEAWLKNWNSRFNKLIDAYDLLEVGSLYKSRINRDFLTDNIHFDYLFEIEGKDDYVSFKIILSDYWYGERFKIRNGNRVKKAEKTIIDLEKNNFRDVDLEYFGLFYKKIKKFIVKRKHIVEQKSFTTRIIRVTSEKIIPKKHIWLDKNLLYKIDLEELL